MYFLKQIYKCENLFFLPHIIPRKMHVWKAEQTDGFRNSLPYHINWSVTCSWVSHSLSLIAVCVDMTISDVIIYVRDTFHMFCFKSLKKKNWTRLDIIHRLSTPCYCYKLHHYYQMVWVYTINVEHLCCIQWSVFLICMYLYLKIEKKRSLFQLKNF